jgi:Outer membrane protein beta-barrel domain
MMITCQYASGQEHRPNYDLDKWHFGISLAPNFAKAKVVLAPDFYQRDSVRSIKTQGFAGLCFGGIADYRVGKFSTIRYLAQIEFSQRNFTFTFDDRQEVAKTESVSLNQCLLYKYHSTRHRNHRFYVIGGLRYSYDFQSNESTIRSPNRPLVPFKANSFYYEYGFGYDHFGIWALISTEFKMSNSLGNILSSDPYIYTSSISRIQARLFQISFHFHN